MIRTIARICFGSALIGWAVVAWRGNLGDIAVYTSLILIGLWAWGRKVIDGELDDAPPKADAVKEGVKSARERVLADININCEVKECGEVSEMECLGIHLCYAHWRLLRPKGMRCLWGFKQKRGE